MNTNENLKTSPLYPVYLVKLFNLSCFSIIHARRIIRRNWNSNAQSFYFFTDRDRNYSLSNVSTFFNPEITSVCNTFKLYTLSKLKQITRFFSPFDVENWKLKLEEIIHRRVSPPSRILPNIPKNPLSLRGDPREIGGEGLGRATRKAGGKCKMEGRREEEKQTAFQFHKFMTHTRGNWSGGVSPPDWLVSIKWHGKYWEPSVPGRKRGGRLRIKPTESQKGGLESDSKLLSSLTRPYFHRGIIRSKEEEKKGEKGEEN